jgi:sialic acid synthase SpsE
MPYIIAEIGFNHEGDMPVARKMIRAASEAGADAVKFQTFRAQDIALPSSPHFELIKCGEMNFEQHQALFDTAKEAGIDFLSTPFSPWAVELLERIGVEKYKIASMDCTNQHLLKIVAQTGKPILLSTGMATLEEIHTSLDFLEARRSGPVTLLHCVSCYPAKTEELNLAIISLFKNVFNRPVGYSDHHVGTKACFAAAVLGAEVIETHFTLDNSKEGGDHYHSVEPEELRALIEAIELFKRMAGDTGAIQKRPDRSQADFFRRGVYSARDLKKGTVLAPDDFLLARPVAALSPNDVIRLSGRTLKENVNSFSEITETLIS